MKRTIVFVNYINRSGSTLLCKLLDSYDGISAGIEAGFPGFIHELIPEQYKKINSKASLDLYLNDLFKDIRFQEWNVDRGKLLSRLEKIGYPLTFKEILLCCLEEYFGDCKAKIWVHKAGYYIDLLEEVLSVFPDSKNIYIVRDPRAIFSSQKQAVSIYEGKSMGYSLCAFIYQYKKRMNVVMNNLSSMDFLVVKYEDLVKQNDYMEEIVLPFLAMQYAKKNGEGNYSEKIPDNQRSLHTNVSSQPSGKSIEKWKKGLQRHEILFIQKKLKSEMQYWGYEFADKQRLTWGDRFLYLKKEMEYLIFSTKNLLYNIVKRTLAN